MFTVYIDDSGTSPSQHVAIATALIIPGAQILRLESEWDRFRKKEDFSDFHTSEFVARNTKSDFANWDDTKRNRVFARVRQISKKYGVKAVSIAVNKKDYEEVVPAEFRSHIGKHHYTWAIRQLISLIHGKVIGPPREYVFDCMGKRTDERRVEVETVMEQAQWLADKNGVPGDYRNYSFRCRKDIPGLQCVDAIGWVCYQKALFLFRRTPTKEFTEDSWLDFGGHLSEKGWLMAYTILRDKLEKLISNETATGHALESLKQWEADTGKKEKREKGK